MLVDGPLYLLLPVQRRHRHGNPGRV